MGCRIIINCWINSKYIKEAKKNIINKLNLPENIDKNNEFLNEIYNIYIKIKEYYNNLINLNLKDINIFKSYWIII